MYKTNGARRFLIYVCSILVIAFALLLLVNDSSPSLFSLIRNRGIPLYKNDIEADLSFDRRQFLQDLPQYQENPSITLNNGRPLFTADDLNHKTVSYSELDSLGRCGVAMGILGPETIPQEERGPLGEIKPTGWHTVRYDDIIEDRYLYNRCHLIGYQLAGENSEPKNLITGTRYLNVVGMLPYENEVWKYITETNNHVIYRITPVFEADNLLASGVLMEAYSIEDRGAGVCFFEYLFNVQPGIAIDYKTGESWVDESSLFSDEDNEVFSLELTLQDENSFSQEKALPDTEEEREATYVLNTNTKRFHDPSCPSVEEMSSKNRQFFYGTREDAIDQGYSPCSRCQP